MSPLLDGYDITDAGQQAFSKRLVEGVAALDAGELPDVFKPASRRRKYVKSYSVSLIQYEFFLMRRLLSRAGFNAEEIGQIFGKHAKANWDTISCWPKKIRAVADGEKLKEIEDKVNKLGKTKTMRSKDGAESAMKKLETRYFEARQTGGKS